MELWPVPVDLPWAKDAEEAEEEASTEVCSHMF